MVLRDVGFRALDEAAKARKSHKPDEIVAKLRQVDVLLSQGRPVAGATRPIGGAAFTCYRWREAFGV